MILNKWILMALGAAVALLGYFGTVDWNTLYPSESGTIVSLIGILKVVLAALMPPNSQPNITKTGGVLFTHT